MSNYGLSSFEEHAKKIQEEVFKNYGVKITKEKVTRDFFKHFDALIYQTIWDFLKDEDKKEIGVIDNLEVGEDEKIKFIEYYSAKVKKLSEMGGEDGEKVDPITIHTFVAKHLGRSIEEIQEMDEEVLINLVEEIVNLLKQERVEKVNLAAIAHAYASGNKSAKSEIKKLTNDAKRSKSKQVRDQKTTSAQQTTDYSADDLRRLARGR